jgi:hypothetical protein
MSWLKKHFTVYTKGNSKKTELKNLMAEEGSNLRLIRVPSHMSITGNSQGHSGPERRSDNQGGQV